MGRLRPAPAGYAVQKDTATGHWYIERRETDARGYVVNIQAIRDDNGFVVWYAKRSGAVTDAYIIAQNAEIVRLRAQVEQLSSGTSRERRVAVS